MASLMASLNDHNAVSGANSSTEVTSGGRVSGAQGCQWFSPTITPSRFELVRVTSNPMQSGVGAARLVTGTRTGKSGAVDESSPFAQRHAASNPVASWPVNASKIVPSAKVQLRPSSLPDSPMRKARMGSSKARSAGFVSGGRLKKRVRVKLAEEPAKSAAQCHSMSPPSVAGQVKMNDVPGSERFDRQSPGAVSIQSPVAPHHSPTCAHDTTACVTPATKHAHFLISSALLSGATS